MTGVEKYDYLKWLESNLRKILDKSFCLDFSGLWVAFHPFGYGAGCFEVYVAGEGGVLRCALRKGRELLYECV